MKGLAFVVVLLLILVLCTHCCKTYVPVVWTHRPKVAIYTVMNNDYFELACVMIHSLNRHLRADFTVTGLYSDNLKNANLDADKIVLAEKHLNMRCRNVDASWLSHIQLYNYKAHPALLSLELFRQEPEGDIVLFLDADMLILSDFSHVFNELTDNCIHGSTLNRFHFHLNSGFFCMTATFLKKQHTKQKIEKRVKNEFLLYLLKKIKTLGDQDIITYTFPVKNHDWYCNYRPSNKKDLRKFHIIHWMGMTKPNNTKGVFNNHQTGPAIMKTVWQRERKLIDWL